MSGQATGKNAHVVSWGRFDEHVEVHPRCATALKNRGTVKLLGVTVDGLCPSTVLATPEALT